MERMQASNYNYNYDMFHDMDNTSIGDCTPLAYDCDPSTRREQHEESNWQQEILANLNKPTVSTTPKDSDIMPPPIVPIRKPKRGSPKEEQHESNCWQQEILANLNKPTTTSSTPPNPKHSDIVPLPIVQINKPKRDSPKKDYKHQSPKRVVFEGAADRDQVCALASRRLVRFWFARKKSSSGTASERDDKIVNLWRHLKACTNPKCDRAHCASSRKLLAHFKRCEKMSCQVCSPVVAIIQKGKLNDKLKKQNKTFVPEKLLKMNDERINSFILDGLFPRNKKSTTKNTNTEAQPPPPLPPLPPPPTVKKRRREEVSTKVKASNDDDTLDSNAMKIYESLCAIIPDDATASNDEDNVTQFCQPCNEPQRKRPRKEFLLEQRKSGSRNEEIHHGHRYHNNNYVREKERQEDNSPNTDLSLNQKVTQLCKPIVEKLINAEEGWIFKDAVDPQSLGLPDYFDIIKRPMDLSTVLQNLEDGKFDSIEQVKLDVMLVYENAIQYNGIENAVGYIASNFLNEVKNEFLLLSTRDFVAV